MWDLPRGQNLEYVGKVPDEIAVAFAISHGMTSVLKKIEAQVSLAKVTANTLAKLFFKLNPLVLAANRNCFSSMLRGECAFRYSCSPRSL